MASSLWHCQTDAACLSLPTVCLTSVAFECDFFGESSRTFTKNLGPFHYENDVVSRLQETRFSGVNFAGKQRASSKEE